MDVTMEKLLPYYERELSMLWRAGAEFAGRCPTLAGNLQLRGERCAYSHVERLMQASACLNPRVGKLFDDGDVQFIDALLGMLYSHYLRPLPSCSIEPYPQVPASLPVPLTLAGLAADEALLPAAPAEHASSRLLSEYFAFPKNLISSTSTSTCGSTPPAVWT